MKHHTRNKPSTACDGCKDSGCDVLSVILFCLSTNHSHINPYPFYISFTCDNNLSEDPPPWRWKVKLKLGRIIWYPYLQPWNHHPCEPKEKGTSKIKRKYHKSMHKYIHTLTSSQVQSMPSIHTKPFQHTYFSSRSFWPFSSPWWEPHPFGCWLAKRQESARPLEVKLGMGVVPYSKNFWMVIVLPEDNFWNMQEKPSIETVTHGRFRM